MLCVNVLCNFFVDNILSVVLLFHVSHCRRQRSTRGLHGPGFARVGPGLEITVFKRAGPEIRGKSPVSKSKR